MKVLLKSAKIIDARSPHHLKKKDILIEKSRILQIGKSIDDPKAKIVESKDLHVSTGWIDVGTQIGEPGLEHRETIETVSKAAANGGYTGLISLPNTKPAVQSKSDIQFIVNKSLLGPVSIYPMGAITRDCKGVELTEMIDMHQNGAKAFSDGNNSIRNAGILLRALQYVKAFDGLVVQQVFDDELTPGSYVHEGEISTRMGLKGIPSLAEKVRVQRDLHIHNYSESRLLLHQLSSGESVKMLRDAMKKEDSLSASVAYLNLIYTDEEVKSFDPAFKVKPPLRSTSDKKQLIKGVLEGVLPVICSNHQPQDHESKSLEFGYASFGNIGLQTVYPALNSFVGELDQSTIIDCLSYNVRKIFGLDYQPIEEGRLAELSFFDPSQKWTFDSSQNQSKSSNSPFFNTTFKGKVLGTYHRGHLHLI